MDRPLVREVGHAVVDGKDHISHLVLVQHVFRLVDQAVYFALGEAVHLSQFPQDTPGSKSRHRPHQSGISGLVAVKDIVIHLVPLIPRKVHIEVRRALPLWV